MTLCRQHGPQRHRSLTPLITLDDMIGRQHQHHCVRVPTDQFHRRQRDGRRGVAGFRFDDEIVLELVFPLSQLEPDRVGLGGSCRDHHPARRDAAENPAHGLLDQGLLPHDPEQLLWVEVPAQRPEPSAAPTGEDDRVEMLVGFHCARFVR